jgi:hypothetical protein
VNGRVKDVPVEMDVGVHMMLRHLGELHLPLGERCQMYIP